MKAKLNGIEIEGTPEELAQLLKLMDGGNIIITYPVQPAAPTYIPYPKYDFAPYERPWITWGDSNTADTSDCVAWYKSKPE